jgi:hypothetical protein
MYEIKTRKYKFMKALVNIFVTCLIGIHGVTDINFHNQQV